MPWPKSRFRQPGVRLMWTSAAMLVLTVITLHGGSRLQEPAAPPTLSDAQIERFLHDARVISTKGIGTGVTGSVRATLSDGTLTHDAQIQTVEQKQVRSGRAGVSEFSADDSWRYNVAAYRVDRLLELGMVPVSVSRKWRERPAAYTWWVDDVLMDEGTRLKRKAEPPDSGVWNEQMDLVRLFDQLIDNWDRNAGNLLIGKSWRVWAIDHTRAFRMHRTLVTPANIRRCDQQVLERLRQLDRVTLKRAVGGVVSDYQIDALLARRDAILGILDKAGAAAVFVRRPA